MHNFCSSTTINKVWSSL